MKKMHFLASYIVWAVAFCSLFLPSLGDAANTEESTALEFPTQAQLLSLKQLEDKVDADIGNFAGAEQDLENCIARNVSQQEELVFQARALSSAQQLVVDEQAVISAYPQNSNILDMEANLVALFQQLVVSNQSLNAQMQSSGNVNTWVTAFNAVLNSENFAAAGIAEKVGILFVDTIPDMPQFIAGQYGYMENAVKATKESIALLEFQK